MILIKKNMTRIKKRSKHRNGAERQKKMHLCFLKIIQEDFFFGGYFKESNKIFKYAIYNKIKG